MIIQDVVNQIKNAAPSERREWYHALVPVMRKLHAEAAGTDSGGDFLSVGPPVFGTSIPAELSDVGE